MLAVLAWVLDYVAALLGAKRAGASRQAVIGAALGTVAGIFMGLIGVFFMPLVGAAIGEFIAHKNHHRAVKVGVASWLGLMAGMLAKVVLAFMMVGIYLVALLV
ncbi:MAG: putative rane protein [Polaromonas sp.]|nr:putative rane protein [Polaromonas sp.]